MLPDMGTERPAWEVMDHRLAHGCQPCKDIQHSGPNGMRCTLGYIPLRVGGQFIPAKSKRSLRNEARRKARISAARRRQENQRRLAEKRAVFASLTKRAK